MQVDNGWKVLVIIMQGWRKKLEPFISRYSDCEQLNMLFTVQSGLRT